MAITKRTAQLLSAAALLLLPASASAQGLGRVACSSREDYIYLYSSMATLDIRSQLKCGQEVQILARYENFYYVRTEKGDTGYVPAESLLLKTKPGAKLTPQSSREKAPPLLTLFDGTPVRLKLGRTVSSAEAHVGDQVTFEVAEDVILDGYTVIRKGTQALGRVSEAEPKGRFGRNGKVTLSLTSVRLTDNEEARLRAYQQSNSERHGVAKVLPVTHGKDVTLAEGTEIFGYVDGGMHLLASKFRPAKVSSGRVPQSASKASN